MNFYQETARLRLQNATTADAAELAKKRSTPFVMRYNLYTPCDEAQILAELDCYEHIVLKSPQTGEIIGAVSIRDDNFRYHIEAKELHAWLTEEYAHQGLMAEALTPIMEKVFADGAERISVRILANNKASLKLAEKLGFIREGYLVRALKNAVGEVFDVALYSLSREMLPKTK